MGNTPNDKTTASLSAQELAALLERGEIRVIDVRSPDEFVAGHIEGAVNVSLDALRHDSPELLGASCIVTVCARGGARSHAGAERLRSMGLKAVPLEGGLTEWERVHGAARTEDAK